MLTTAKYLLAAGLVAGLVTLSGGTKAQAQDFGIDIQGRGDVDWDDDHGWHGDDDHDWDRHDGRDRWRDGRRWRDNRGWRGSYYSNYPRYYGYGYSSPRYYYRSPGYGYGYGNSYYSPRSYYYRDGYYGDDHYHDGRYRGRHSMRGPHSSLQLGPLHLDWR